ncbi:MAG: DNA primase large subunit PriL [Candidatus Methanomethyliaceae archaeon]|nr:DNA primase large subunit PriL [Candidatus Methanomethyliaceae archaeon]MDW7970449.1 DNA primase large subunit PriL [Nitrososphaerota archaeon]
MLTIEDLAKYPFLNKATSYIAQFGLTLDDFSSGEFNKIIDRALMKLKYAIEGKILRIDSSELDIEILSHALALALAYGMKNAWIVRRFANIEQKKCYELMKAEESKKLIEIAKDGFGWNLELADINGYDFSMPLNQFLQIAPKFQSQSWKLVNFMVSNGKVYIKKEKIARLLSEAVKIKILKKMEEEEVKRMKIPEELAIKLKDIKKLIRSRREIMEEREVPKEGAIPPCISAIMKDVKEGKPVSHMARFTVTAFLLNIGMSVEEIFNFFKNIADFDENKALYQIRHIAGMIGSKTKYIPPKCEVLKSSGLCINQDKYCEKVKHPLQYYKIRRKGL